MHYARYGCGSRAGVQVGMVPERYTDIMEVLYIAYRGGQMKIIFVSCTSPTITQYTKNCLWRYSISFRIYA
jgi:hypothetical protein